MIGRIDDTTPFPAQSKNSDLNKQKPFTGMGASSDFEEMQQKQSYFVDKTTLISDILSHPSHVISITRPSHFGKSSALSMLEYFIDSEKHKNLVRKLNYDPFSNYLIKTNYSLRIAEYKGKQTVIHLNFLELAKDNYEEFLCALKELLCDLYLRFSYIKKLLDDKEEIEFFSRICSPSTAIQEDKDILMNALQRLCLFISHCNNKTDKTKNSKPIMLIDEFDAPFLMATQCGYLTQMTEILNGILSPLIYGNSFVEQMVFFGITDATAIMRYQSHLSFYSVHVCTLAHHDFSGGFGYTESEVKKILKDGEFNVEKEYPKLLEQYGHYYCGDKMLFNPFSISRAIKKNTIDLANHWLESQMESYITTIIPKISTSSRNFLKQLIQQHFVVSVIDTLILYNPPVTDEKMWVCNMLYAAGFLTAIPSPIQTKTRTLIIPNQEVYDFFINQLDVNREEYPYKNRCEVIQEVEWMENVKLFLSADQEKMFESIMRREKPDAKINCIENLSTILLLLHPQYRQMFLDRCWETDILLTMFNTVIDLQAIMDCLPQSDQQRSVLIRLGKGVLPHLCKDSNELRITLNYIAEVDRFLILEMFSIEQLEKYICTADDLVTVMEMLPENSRWAFVQRFGNDFVKRICTRGSEDITNIVLDLGDGILPFFECIGKPFFHEIFTCFEAVSVLASCLSEEEEKWFWSCFNHSDLKHFCSNADHLLRMMELLPKPNARPFFNSLDIDFLKNLCERAIDLLGIAKLILEKDRPRFIQMFTFQELKILCRNAFDLKIIMNLLSTEAQRWFCIDKLDNEFFIQCCHEVDDLDTILELLHQEKRTVFLTTFGVDRLQKLCRIEADRKQLNTVLSRHAESYFKYFVARPTNSQSESFFHSSLPEVPRYQMLRTETGLHFIDVQKTVKNLQAVLRSISAEGMEENSSVSGEEEKLVISLMNNSIFTQRQCANLNPVHSSILKKKK